jgi:aminoglycoside 3-N-acetyltransferase I
LVAFIEKTPSVVLFPPSAAAKRCRGLVQDHAMQCRWRRPSLDEQRVSAVARAAHFIRNAGRPKDAARALKLPRMNNHMRLHHLQRDDLALMSSLLTMFSHAFDDAASYDARRPSPGYLRTLLGRDTFIALAAVEGGEVVGGLTAYVLHKFEQERSEIYIYDLAVAPTHRRRGIATALIDELRTIGRARGAWVIFVQADRGDDAAIALYDKLGVREEVLHFDITMA